MDRSFGVRVTGPLEPYASGFGAELTRLGYTFFSTRDQLRLVAHLSRWLAGQGLDAVALTETTVARFVLARRGAGYTHGRSAKVLVPLLGARTHPVRRQGRPTTVVSAASRPRREAWS